MNNKYKILTYSKSCRSAEEAAKELGLDLSQLLKSLLVKSENRFLLVLLSSDKKLNFEAINKIYGESFSMASSEEVHKVTGYHIGVVSPFGLKQKTEVLIDQSCLEFDLVGVGSGTRGEEIVLKPQELLSDKEVNAKSHILSIK